MWAMGYAIEVQKKRKNSVQWKINLPATLAKIIEFKKG
jgi:hypothetical protein